MLSGSSSAAAPTLPPLHVAHLRAAGESVLVMGEGEAARQVLEALRAAGAPEPHSCPAAADVAEIVERTRPGRIIVALDERRGALPAAPLLEARLRGVIVEDGAAAYERITGKLAIERLVPSALIFSRPPFGARLHGACARAVSLAVACVGLIAAAPLLALVALAVWLESPGPILFVHERLGRQGRRFGLLKFRTMRAEGPRPSEWVADNAHRLTRIGRFLRRWHLDELPQFLNLLRGEMDLIGPRPHPASNLDLFNARIPWYHLRLAVRPGLTGWAQVRYGYANDLLQETEKMRYDLYYIKHRSLRLDLRILAETARIVLLGRGTERIERWRARGGAHVKPMNDVA